MLSCGTSSHARACMELALSRVLVGNVLSMAACSGVSCTGSCMEQALRYPIYLGYQIEFTGPVRLAAGPNAFT